MRKVLSIAALVSLDLLVLWFGFVSRLVLHISVLDILQGGTMLTLLVFAALVVMFMLIFKLIEMIVNNFK